MTSPDFVGPTQPPPAPPAAPSGTPGEPGFVGPVIPRGQGDPAANDFVGPVIPRGQGEPTAPDFVGPPVNRGQGQPGAPDFVGPVIPRGQGDFTAPDFVGPRPERVGPPTEAEVMAARPEYGRPDRGIEGIGEAVQMSIDARAGLGVGERTVGGKKHFAFTQVDKKTGKSKLLADSKRSGKFPLTELKDNFDTVVQSMLRDIKTIKDAGYDAQPLEKLLKGVNKRNPRKSSQEAMDTVLTGLADAVAKVKKQGRVKLTTEELADAAKRIVGPMPEGKEAERPYAPSKKVSKAYQDTLDKTKARKRKEKADERALRELEAETKAKQAKEDKQAVEAAEKAKTVKARRAKKYEKYKDLKVSVEQPTDDGDIVMVSEPAGKLLEESDERIDGLKALLECVMKGGS